MEAVAMTAIRQPIWVRGLCKRAFVHSHLFSFNMFLDIGSIKGGKCRNMSPFPGACVSFMENVEEIGL